MAQQDHVTQGRLISVVDAPDDGWGPDPLPQIDLDDDLRAAVERAIAADERLIVVDGGTEIAALIPIADLRLLLRLEESELDRIDVENIRQAREDPESQHYVSLEQVKAELGF